MDRDFGELLGIGVKVDGTVGEHGDMVLETHQERSGYQRCSWLGLDDLQGRTHGIGRGVDGTGHEAVRHAHHHKHGAEIAVIGQLFARLLFGHAFLGAQLAQLRHHGFQHRFIILGLEFRLAKRFQSQFLTTGENGVFVSDDDQIDDVAFQQIIGGFDDAILVALRQHDGLLVRLRLAQQTVLESIGCGRGVEWRFEYRGQFRGVDVRRERFVCLADGVIVIEIDGR